MTVDRTPLSVHDGGDRDAGRHGVVRADVDVDEQLDLRASGP
jgi:hypothetical protein